MAVLEWPEAASRQGVGGEVAAPQALCPKAECLMTIWERAEAAWATAEAGR